MLSANAYQKNIGKKEHWLENQKVTIDVTRTINKWFRQMLEWHLIGGVVAQLQRRLLPTVSPAAGHLTSPTVAGLPGLCENFRPTTSKSSPILRLLSSHWATGVVRTRVVGVANVVDSLRRLCSLQHRIYNILGLYPQFSRRPTERVLCE